MNYDSMLEYVGEMGSYQKRKIFYVALAIVPNAIHACSVVFNMIEPSFRCAVPGLTNDTYKIQNEAHRLWVDTFVPVDSDTQRYSQCDVISGSWNGSQSSVNTNNTYNCDRWVYEPVGAESSAAAEWDLVCDNKSFKVHFNSMVMLGLLVGSLFGGTLSDYFGRRHVFVMSLLTEAVFGIGLAFISSPYAYMAFRFILSFACIGVYISAFVLVAEIVGPKWRIIATTMCLFGWCAGLFVLTFVCYFVRDWRHAQLVSSVPWLGFVAYYWLMDESPRWLINKGRLEEARAVIETIAKVNKTSVPEEVELKASMEVKDGGQAKEEKVWHFCTSRVLVIRILILVLGWCTASMVYFGLTLNVGTLIEGDIYVNFTVQAVLELCGYAVTLLLLERTGRKNIYCGALLLSGLACLAMTGPIFAQSDTKWVTILLFGLGKFGITAAFALVYIVTTELLPTPLRNSGLGLCSCLGRIAAVLSPYIASIGDSMSSKYGKTFPMVIFGAFAVTAGLASLCLPESRNRKLAETIKECEEFDKARKPIYTITADKENDAMA